MHHNPDDPPLRITRRQRSLRTYPGHSIPMVGHSAHQRSLWCSTLAAVPQKGHGFSSLIARPPAHHHRWRTSGELRSCLCGA
jgi:hypothetical protein